jgi:hypothetical protein
MDEAKSYADLNFPIGEVRRYIFRIFAPDINALIKHTLVEETQRSWNVSEDEAERGVIIRETLLHSRILHISHGVWKP